jgi:putative molybdopterin biosynthesis protein
MDLPNLYTPDEIAKHLHVARGTIYSLISRGEIDSIKVGRNRRFTSKHVKDYIDRRGEEIITIYSGEDS